MELKSLHWTSSKFTYTPPRHDRRGIGRAIDGGEPKGTENDDCTQQLYKRTTVTVTTVTVTTVATTTAHG